MNLETSLQTGQPWGRGWAALASRGAGPQTTEPEESPHSRRFSPVAPAPGTWGSRLP